MFNALQELSMHAAINTERPQKNRLKVGHYGKRFNNVEEYNHLFLKLIILFRSEILSCKQIVLYGSW